MFDRSRTVAVITIVVALIPLAGCASRSKATPSPETTPAASPSVATSVIPTELTTPTPSPDVAGRTPESVLRAVRPTPAFLVDQPAAAAWSGTRFIIATNSAAALGPMIIPASFSGSQRLWPLRSGRPYDAPGNPNHAYPGVWFWSSSDGQTWSTTGETGSGLVRAYAFDGAAGVAVGWGAGGGVVWTSPDGRSWTRLAERKALQPSGGEVGLILEDVAHGPAGYVALGSVTLPTQLTPSGFTNPTLSALFWSPDGRTWHRELMGTFRNASLSKIVEVDSRYAISGFTAGTDFPTVWTSTDGRTWTQETPVDKSSGGAMFLAAESGEALLAVVRSGRCAAWRSSDGLAWTQATFGCPMGQPGSALMAGPSQFVASEPGGATSTAGPCLLTFAKPNLYFCAALIEISLTGQEWTSLRAPTPAGELIAASPNEVLWWAGGLWIADTRTGQ